MEVEIRRLCDHCGGDGVMENPPPGSNGECPVCRGSGRAPAAIEVSDLNDVLQNILDKVDDVLDKCNDILDEVQGG